MAFKVIFDASKFKNAFNVLTKTGMPGAAAKGLRAGAQQLKIDADTIPPKTPHLEGTLRGSGEVSDVTVTNTTMTAEVSYKTPYAEKWHEIKRKVNWSEPGVGANYLRSKLLKYGFKYFKIAGEFVKSLGK